MRRESVEYSFNELKEKEKCFPKSNVFKRLEKLTNVSRKYPNKTLTNKLYTLMYSEELYELAYNKLKSNKGIDTPSLNPDTLDGFSQEFIDYLINSLRNESFKFSNVRKVDIPKPKGGFRTLGVTSPKDKLVQEVIRIILEHIYEPIFVENSHGYRPGKGCHTALNFVYRHFQSSR